MDAKTIYHLLKPQLEKMEETERESLSKLIVRKGINKSRRVILSLQEAKEKLKLYRALEIQRSRQQEV